MVKIRILTDEVKSNGALLAELGRYLDTGGLDRKFNATPSDWSEYECPFLHKQFALLANSYGSDKATVNGFTGWIELDEAVFNEATVLGYSVKERCTHYVKGGKAFVYMAVMTMETIVYESQLVENDDYDPNDPNSSEFIMKQVGKSAYSRRSESTDAEFREWLALVNQDASNLFTDPKEIEEKKTQYIDNQASLEA